MTLASKLLEGYCPEGYESIEEGLTPDEIMVRTNAICTECISCLYEAAELFCTEDIVASTEVLTEGAGVVDKIKELADKFVKRMKAIWDWFIKKVKAFPGWIRGLFKKKAEQVDQIAAKVVERTVNVNVPEDGKIRTVKLSILDKSIKQAQRLTKQIEQLIGSDFATGVSKKSDELLDPNNFLKTYDAAKKSGESYDEFAKHALKSTSEDKEEILNSFGVESFGEITSAYSDIVEDISKANSSGTREVIDRSKFNSYLNSVKSMLKNAENGSIKSIDAAIKKFEKTLQTFQSDQFKASLVKAFTDTHGKHSGVPEAYLRSIASCYVSTCSKVSSDVVGILNVVMGGQTGLIKVYSKVVDTLNGFALSDMGQRRLVAEDNGDDD